MLGAGLLLGLSAQPAMAQKKINMVAATSVLDVTYPVLTLPLTLGYWKAEGLDVDLQPAGGSLQVVQQVVGGGAQFGAGSGSSFVSGAGKNNLPVRIAYSIASSDWSLGVMADGPIKTGNDLKGKTIGVFSLASGGVAFLNGLLAEYGFKPGDVEMISVGMGAAPVDAMKTGKAQGLIYWGSAIAGFENAGLDLRKIVGKEWPTMPEYSVGVLQSYAEKNPDIVIAMGRGMAKATVYALANPECAVKLHWQHYPATRTQGADDATLLKRDLNSMGVQLASSKNAREQFGEGKFWGKFDPAAWNRLSKFMLEAKQIDAPFDASVMGLKIPGLYEKINDFDANAVMAAAKACKV